MVKDYERKSDSWSYRPVDRFPIRDKSYKTKSKRPRPWLIESRWRDWGNTNKWQDWHVLGKYRTKDERDKTLKDFIRKDEDHIKFWKQRNPDIKSYTEYRAIDPE